MKTCYLSTLALVVIFIFSSCKKELIFGKGAIVSETRAVSNFTRVTIDGSADVEIKQGSIFKVTASDYQNLINDLETYLVGDELRIGYKNNVWVAKGKGKVTIEMPLLNEIKVDGSGNFVVNGPFVSATNFITTINGSGNTQLNNMSLNSCSFIISGSGKINVANSTANNCTVRIGGSGDVHAFGMPVNQMEVDVNGSGKTETTVAAVLKVTIRGSGDVYYMGNPSVTTSINGSGKVVKR